MNSVEPTSNITNKEVESYTIRAFPEKWPSLLPHLTESL